MKYSASTTTELELCKNLILHADTISDCLYYDSINNSKILFVQFTSKGERKLLEQKRAIVKSLVYAYAQDDFNSFRSLSEYMDIETGVLIAGKIWEKWTKTITEYFDILIERWKVNANQVNQNFLFAYLPVKIV